MERALRPRLMQEFRGKALSWELSNGVIEVALHREPCNEIGAQSLDELERLAGAAGQRHQETDGGETVLLCETLRTDKDRCVFRGIREAVR